MPTEHAASWRPCCSWVPCSCSQARLGGFHSVSSTFETLEAQMVHFSRLGKARVQGAKGHKTSKEMTVL